MSKQKVKTENKRESSRDFWARQFAQIVKKLDQIEAAIRGAEQAYQPMNGQLLSPQQIIESVPAKWRFNSKGEANMRVSDDKQGIFMEGYIPEGFGEFSKYMRQSFGYEYVDGTRTLYPEVEAKKLKKKGKAVA
jgi:hypothetical protein